MLASGRLDAPTAARAIATIDRNTHVQMQLIEDLLDISRIAAGKIRLELTTVTIGSLVEAALDAVRHAAEVKGVAIESAIIDDVPITCDAARMQQVMWNLLTNAIKFTPAGGQVRVQARTSGDRLTVSVTDSGAGIAPDFLPFVFDRFRQQQVGSTREQGGLGLGLAIVRELVVMHGGRIDASSEGEGKGATFVVELPLAEIRPAGRIPATPAVFQPDSPAEFWPEKTP